MRVSPLVLGLALIAATANHARAQTLLDGEWSGQVVKDNGDAHQYPVTVKHVGDSLDIRVVVGTEAIAFQRIRQSGDTLRFAVPDGNGLTECRVLRLPSGSYRGPCQSADGIVSELTLTPPAPKAKPTPTTSINGAGAATTTAAFAAASSDATR